MPDWYFALETNAAVLFSSVLLIVVIFLIARVSRVGQASALALALSPMAFVLAFDRAILPALL